jgi:hypothetical protein
VGGTCGTHGRGEECVQDFDGKSRRKGTTWKTIGGRMGSEWILGRLATGVYSESSWLKIGTGVGLL